MLHKEHLGCAMVGLGEAGRVRAVLTQPQLSTGAKFSDVNTGVGEEVGRGRKVQHGTLQHELKTRTVSRGL